MPGKVIGTEMLVGYPGSVARNADCIIEARPVKTAELAFGKPAILNSDNTYDPFGAANVAADFVGVAVREVKQTTDYYNPDGSYLVGQPADVIRRGNVMVVCNVGTPTANGDVYIRVAENVAIPAGIVGGFEAEADDVNTIKLTNAKWATGKMDANRVVELAILSKQ